MAKPRNDNNDDDYDDDNNNKDVVIDDDDNNNKDVVIASTIKKNDDHDVIFFVPVVVAIAAVDEGVIHPCRYLLTSMPSRRRRGRDPSLPKPRSANDNKNNDALIASASKNDKDHLRSLSGLRMRVEFPAQPEAKRQRGGGRGGGGGGDKRQRDNQPVQMK